MIVTTVNDAGKVIKTSQAYNEFLNLHRLAKAHRLECERSCGISLWTLRNTARRLLPFVWDSEKKHCLELLDNTIDWI